MSKQRACVAVLLDRSGSMQVNKAETISAFNQYVKNTKKNFKGRFTLTQFDSQGIDTPQANVKIKEIQDLTDHTFQPRGATPLLDAIGRTIHAMDTEGFDNVIFVIITDGAENASTEYNREAVKKLIEERVAKGWQVSYLGADVDAFAEGAQLGIAAGQSINFAGAHTSAVMDSYAASNMRYASRSDLLDTSVANFTSAERTAAMGGTEPEEKKGKKKAEHKAA